MYTNTSRLKRRKLSHDDSEIQGDVQINKESKSHRRNVSESISKKDENEDELQINSSDVAARDRFNGVIHDARASKLSRNLNGRNSSAVVSESSGDSDSSDGEQTITIRSSGRQRKAPRRYSNEMLKTASSSKPKTSSTKNKQPRGEISRGSPATAPQARRAPPSIGRKKGPGTRSLGIHSDSIHATSEDEIDGFHGEANERQSSPELDLPSFTPAMKRSDGLTRIEPIPLTFGGAKLSPSAVPKSIPASLIQQATLSNRRPQPTIPKSKSITASHTDAQDIFKHIVLSKLTGRRSIPLVDLDEERATVYSLLKQTVAAGEGNSMLLIGPRGTGKTALVNNVLQELTKDYGNDFHVIRLSGFIHTDDKLALREIWRQLGRQLNDEQSTLKNYADILATLLALLSHPTESADSNNSADQVAQSVVFIMEEFDLFAAHPRQTLLYNLFDIAQSRKAPIAVLGLSARVDVMDSLEKRVKSRFSHRYVYISLAKNFPSFIEMCKKAMQLRSEELDSDERAKLIGQSSPDGDSIVSDLLQPWNSSIETLLAQPLVKQHLMSIYYTTKSLPTALSLFYVPVINLTSGNAYLDAAAIPTPASLLPPDSKLELLASLPTLSLAMLIAAARLDIILDSDTCNFNMAYDEYCTLGARARVSGTASTGTASVVVGVGGKVAGRAVARTAWEKLVDLELLIPVSAHGLGLSSSIGGGVSVVGPGDMVKCDIKLEEIEASTPGLEKALVKWCRAI